MAAKYFGHITNPYEDCAAHAFVDLQFWSTQQLTIPTLCLFSFPACTHAPQNPNSRKYRFSSQKLAVLPSCSALERSSPLGNRLPTGLLFKLSPFGNEWARLGNESSRMRKIVCRVPFAEVFPRRQHCVWGHTEVTRELIPAVLHLGRGTPTFGETRNPRVRV